MGEPWSRSFRKFSSVISTTSPISLVSLLVWDGRVLDGRRGQTDKEDGRDGEAELRPNDDVLNSYESDQPLGRSRPAIYLE
eukprot:CAMPEP_0174892446 /NCGR_PEP_ID=MMETSP0167-20121228/7401_1 /TAXON_ID=38298 /ORGANISM="Rhodella maculata, Strain CCMP736" /LENGTH=80 /DNA_ID=CAMNT_0016130947 /DNA_START=375 /DNA_END=617 /DNA_ORIENTATION=-